MNPQRVQVPLEPGRGLADLRDHGQHLKRPECVLCTRNGDVFVSDWRGGVTRIAADGTHTLIAGVDSPVQLKPNGIALDRDGSFLLAHLDDKVGGVYRLQRDGRVEPFLLEVDGVPLHPTNFVLTDAQGRVWITVSTRQVPRQGARVPGCADGYLILVDARGARVVVDDIGFANECRFDPSGEWLYVNETWARRISRHRVDARGMVGAREEFIAFDSGVYPDGLDFDESGAVWLTSVYSNQVLRVTPDRTVTVVVDDSDRAFVENLVGDFAAGKLREGRATLDQPWQRMGSISSVAFGGPDRQMLYIGCLLDNRIYRMPVPVRGLKPAHWDVVVAP